MKEVIGFTQNHREKERTLAEIHSIDLVLQSIKQEASEVINILLAMHNWEVTQRQ